jgi:hypothetical protein
MAGYCTGRGFLNLDRRLRLTRSRGWAASRVRRSWRGRIEKLREGGHKLRRREGFCEHDAIRNALDRPIFCV